MIPEELKNVSEYLSAQNIQLPAHGTNSRQDSATAESHIVHILQNSRRDMDIREIYSPNVGQRTNRAWYDVKVDDHFCDIKVSALRTNDNIFSAIGEDVEIRLITLGTVPGIFYSRLGRLL